MYSRYILLSALLVIGAETYAKNNKTEVVSLSSSYNNSVDSSSQDSIFKDFSMISKAEGSPWRAKARTA